MKKTMQMPLRSEDGFSPLLPRCSLKATMMHTNLKSVPAHRCWHVLSEIIDGEEGKGDKRGKREGGKERKRERRKEERGRKDRKRNRKFCFSKDLP